jgi:hypothetical protein
VIEHSVAGLRALLAMPGKRGVGEVAIERPDGPVAEALLEAGITVVVISPNQVKDLRGRDHPHAVRILARAWLYVIWHCWQDGTAYDPARHKALQRILAGQKPAA